VQALELSVPVSLVMAKTINAESTVFSSVRPEVIYLGVESVSRVQFSSEFRVREFGELQSLVVVSREL
jgi:hypothetical protein